MEVFERNVRLHLFVCSVLTFQKRTKPEESPLATISDGEISKHFTIFFPWSDNFFLDFKPLPVTFHIWIIPSSDELHSCPCASTMKLHIFSLCPCTSPSILFSWKCISEFWRALKKFENADLRCTYLQTPHINSSFISSNNQQLVDQLHALDSLW